MQILLITIHVIAAVLLILVILLQQGKGGGMASLFGGGSGMDDMLSAPGSDNVLKKITATLATIFLLTSLVLAIRTSRSSTESIMDNTPSAPASQPKSAAPAEQNDNSIPLPEENSPAE